MVSVEYHDDLKEVQGDTALAGLLDAGKSSAPFDRIAWWQALCEHCGIDPLLCIAREGDEIAVLALRRDGSRLASLANWYTFRLRPVLTPGADAARLLGAIAAGLAGQTHRIELAPLPDEDGSASALEAAFRAAGWLAVRETCDSNHFLEVGGRSFADYLSARPGPLRTTLSRKGARVSCEVLDRFDPAVWADYQDIYGESWKPAEGAPGFLRAFAQAEGAAGRLRLGIARLDGQAVAAQMWTVEGGTAFIHKLAHRQSARSLSPGTALSAAMFRHVLDEDRVETVDFGTGDEAYKRDWMEQVRPRHRLILMRWHDSRNWPIVLKTALKRLAARAKHG